jgi:hypothetical protein
MELSRPSLVVAFELSQKRKAILADALAGASAVVYLTELDETARAEALRNTGALLTFNPSKELRPGEIKLLDGAGLIQFMIGGVDFIPLGELPDGVPVAKIQWRGRSWRRQRAYCLRGDSSQTISNGQRAEAVDWITENSTQVDK